MVSSVELWRAIPGIEGYQASNLGNIRSIRNTYQRMHKGKLITSRKKQLLVGPKLSLKGYKRVRLNGKVHLVHRVIALTWVTNTHNKAQVNHINGVKTDNRASNLEWVTNQENRDHAVALNLHSNRSNGRCKLSWFDIDVIITLRGFGWYQTTIAQYYGVCKQTISKVLTTNRGR